MEINNKTNDNEIIEKIINDNKELFEEIVKRYRTQLIVYIKRLVGNQEEAEDILQNVFVIVYKNLISFDLDKKFSSWIYRISHNEAISYIRKKALRNYVMIEDITETGDAKCLEDENKTDSELLKEEKKFELLEALNKLPTKQRNILKLRYFEELSYKDIEEKTGEKSNTIASTINRAKKALKETLE